MKLLDLVRVSEPTKEQDFEEFGNESTGIIRIKKNGWFSVREALAWDEAMLKFKKSPSSEKSESSEEVKVSSVEIAIVCVTVIMQQRVDPQWDRETTLALGSIQLVNDLFEFFNQEYNQHKPPENMRFEGLKARECAIAYAKENGGLVFSREKSPYLYVVFEDIGKIAPQFLLEWQLVEASDNPPTKRGRKNVTKDV